MRDIVVTARKQAEPRSSVPMSLIVLDDDTLKGSRVDNWADLADQVPGLTVSPSLRGTPIPTLRGVGFNDPSLSATSPVAIYMDEAGYPYSAMNAGPMLDMERVEVLKGPQGTLFGRNATGGLINYVTRQPDTPGGHIRLTSGSWGRHTVEAAATVRAHDTVHFRVAGLVDRTSEGWQQRRSGPETLGRDRKAALRASMLWEPAAGSRLLVSANWWQDRSDTQAPQSFGLYPQALVAQGIGPEGWPAAAAALGLPESFLDQSFTPRDSRDADWVTKQMPWGGSTFTPAPLALCKDNHFRSALVRFDQDMGGSITLTVLGHHARLARQDVNDAAGWTIENALLRADGRAESTSQEVRLAGESSGLSWLIGASHARDSARDVDDAWVGASSNLQLLRIQAAGLAALGGADQATQAEALYGARAARNRATQKTDSLALFGEANAALTPALTLTAGLRASRDIIRFAGCSADLGDGNLAATLNPFYSGLGIPSAIGPGDCVTFLGDIAPSVLSGGAVPFPPQGEFRARLEEHSLTGRLALRWTPAQGRMAYISVSRGTKAGTFPNLEANLAAQYAPARQERLIAVEGGGRVMLGGWFSLASSLFYYDYRDKQVFGAVKDILFNTLSRIVNVPQSHAYGADMQVQMALPGGWSGELTAAWLKTRIDDYVGYDEFGTLRSFAGGVFSYAPERELVGTARKAFAVSSDISCDIALTYRHASSSWADMTRDPLFRISGYDQLDLRVSLRLAQPDITLNLRVENLTDQYRWTNAYIVNDSLTRYAARPRSWSLSLVHAW